MSKGSQELVFIGALSRYCTNERVFLFCCRYNNAAQVSWGNLSSELLYFNSRVHIVYFETAYMTCYEEFKRRGVVDTNFKR